MSEPVTHPATAPVPKPVDPTSIMWNPARMMAEPDTSCKTLLDLDEVFRRVPLPASFTPIWPEGALQLDPQKVLTNDQGNLDFAVVTYVVNYKQGHYGKEPDDATLNSIAHDSGVSFRYRGKNYLNTVEWTPTPP